jgi:hypothetical protein
MGPLAHVVMRVRPVYVGLICWFLVFYNAWMLTHAFTVLSGPSIHRRMAEVPLPVEFQVAQYFLSFLVPMTMAAFMTEGANWARVTYIIWGIIHYLIEVVFVADRESFLLDLGIFAFCAAMLLLPSARAYFTLPRHHS